MGAPHFIYKTNLSVQGALLRPAISDKINKTRKTKNRIFAIPAAPAAIPPKPKIAATKAIIAKMTVHRNIKNDFKLKKSSN